MKKQMSETLLIGIFLAFIGGFLDAYTYLCRGHVFANAQTGNIVLLGISLIEGRYTSFLLYLFPILAFFVGIIIAEMIKHHFRYHPHIHWRQIVLVIECITLAITIFLPENMNMLCNIMISFVCSLQVESFRKFNGNPYASTMCTGNLRSATEHLYQYFHHKTKDSLFKSLQYYIIIAVFIVGAIVGAYATSMLSLSATIIPMILLMITVLFMFIKEA